MADDEQFSLCWNNFNTNLSAGFHESLCRGDLVDVSLAAEGQIVKAHRLVLSVCSPFFRKMFTQMPSNTHAIVFLNNVSHSALKDLIQFMYCGEVNVKQDALPAFISTAESLQIKGLTDNDPAPQAPPEPAPTPPAPHVQQQQQQQQVPAQRVQRQQPRTSARYKIETMEDVLGDEKGTTQIVIQTTSAPQATIVQQQQPTQHIQTQQLQAGTTTTATLVSTNKRSAQRSSLTGTGAVKRSKTSIAAASNVIDPLDSNPETATAQPQQITVQTTVVAADKQVTRQQTQQTAASEPEYIDLPMELPTKSEPDYTEEHGEVAGDGEASYVEDDTYGDMRYDDSYFTENEDASGAQAAANTSSGGNVAATTSKAVIKQQQTSQSYSESSFVDTGGEQGSAEAQGFSFSHAPKVMTILHESGQKADSLIVAMPKPVNTLGFKQELNKSEPDPDPCTLLKKCKCSNCQKANREKRRRKKLPDSKFTKTASFGISNKNQITLLIDNNTFISHIKEGEMEGTWRCSKQTTNYCKARAVTRKFGSTFKYIVTHPQHTH
ncbi:modifier of mdg4-like isoform X5 [Scaptodrosophila lebanonensis]|uniref:Modifier of mdg4-like isoform X5 n=1 Tax=Drosophila lebanonensis TaxID=7225 RepID=A0A6J2TIG8_DROLE|nr:modifier of mdg4-like isoform X5 [Scaptodrosophila lebanonensis]